MPQDYGTFGNAVAASPSSDSSSDTTTVVADTDTVQRAVAANKIARQDNQQRMRELDERSDALRPPTLETPPQAPQAQQTPPEQRWGSFAMILAAFGGALTRAPLTTSLNAMAAVNNAYNTGDQQATQQAMEQWKVANANADKMNQFTMQAYSDSLRKLQTDRSAAIAEGRYTSAALKDDIVQALFDAGHPDQAFAIIAGRAAATRQMSEAAKAVQARIQYHHATHPNESPEDQQRADLQIQAGGDPDQLLSKDRDKEGQPQMLTVGNQTLPAVWNQTQGAWFTADGTHQRIEGEAGNFRLAPRSGPSAASKKDARLQRQAEADFRAQFHRDPDPNNPDDVDAVDRAYQKEQGDARLAGTRETGAQREAENDRAQAKAAVETTLGRPVDPNSADDRVQLAQAEQQQKAKRITQEATARATAAQTVRETSQALDPDTVRVLAQQLRLTGKMPALGLGGNEARKQILTEWARQVRADNGSLAEDLARQADIGALHKTMDKLKVSEGNVANFENTAAKEADIALEKLQKGSGGATPFVNRWLQAGRKSIEGDADVASFNAAITSFKNEYARIMSNSNATGGQTSDAARNEADSLINAAMSPDQIRDVITTMKRGMTNRVNSIRDEYDAARGRIVELGGQVTGGTAAPADVPRITNDDAGQKLYDGLAPGTVFLGPDGIKHRKG
jgi:hypothetical protein